MLSAQLKSLLRDGMNLRQGPEGGCMFKGKNASLGKEIREP